MVKVSIVSEGTYSNALMVVAFSIALIVLHNDLVGSEGCCRMDWWWRSVAANTIVFLRFNSS